MQQEQYLQVVVYLLYLMKSWSCCTILWLWFWYWSIWWNIAGAQQTTLNGALLADTNGTGGSGTVINVTSNTGFPTAGTIAGSNELITYTGKGTNTLTGITRGAFGTATVGTSNGQAHSNGATVTDASNFTGFGSAVQASNVTLEPGLWSLSNFGQVLVATIANGKTFTWNAGAASPLTVRASTVHQVFLQQVIQLQQELH